jgi:hypothetical protein
MPMSIPVSVTLERLKCFEQEDTEPPLIDTEDDEPYVIVLAVNGQGRAIIPGTTLRFPESLVTRVGPIEGFDKGDLKPAPANMVWGLDHSPAEMVRLDQVFFLVALLENDSADPAKVENRVAGFAQSALSGLRLNAEAATGLNDAARNNLFIQNALQAFDGIVSLARQAIDPDDQIGPAQILTFTDQEHREVQERSRPAVERALRFTGDDADYEMTFALRLLDKTANRQSDWRACRKCQGLFFGPFGGRCPAGDAHDPAGSFNYGAIFDCTPGRQMQGDWRACRKCQGLFFGPFGGRCPAGDAHDPAGSFNYGIMNGLSPTNGVQLDWRACRKCQGLFFGPFGGRCPAGDAHDAAGSFNYGVQFQ